MLHKTSMQAIFPLISSLGLLLRIKGNQLVLNPCIAESTFCPRHNIVNNRQLSKPFHVGIHLKALAEYYHMSTHLPGFQSFSGFFTSFCIGHISYQQHKG